MSCRSSRGWLNLATCQLSSKAISQPRLIFSSPGDFYDPSSRLSPHQGEPTTQNFPFTTDSLRRTRFSITDLHAHASRVWLPLATCEPSSKTASPPRLVLSSLDNLYGSSARFSPGSRLLEAGYSPSTTDSSRQIQFGITRGRIQLTGSGCHEHSLPGWNRPHSGPVGTIQLNSSGRWTAGSKSCRSYQASSISYQSLMAGTACIARFRLRK